MSYEDDYDNEEDKIIEGYCHRCEDYIYGLTRCPEHGEDVKDNCWLGFTYCIDCCKEALDNSECDGSCEKNFVEEHRKSAHVPD